MGKGQASTQLIASTYRPLHAQASTEYMILLAMALITMTLVMVFVYLWPDYTYSVRKQRSDDYWQNARPFSVKSHSIYPSQLLLEIENTEPVTLVVQKLWIDGNPMNYYSHSVPFGWAATDECTSACAMAVRPGQVRIISSENFTTNPQNPCVDSNGFTAGLDYEVEFRVQYYYTDKNQPENQTGKFSLIGSCTER